MATEDQGMSYYQGSFGLNYLADNVPSMKSFMKSLIKNLDESTRKNLYLTFQDGELFKPSDPAKYQIKIIRGNQEGQKLLRNVQNFLLENGDVLLTKRPNGKYANFKSGLQLYISGGRLKNVMGENGKPIASAAPKTDQQEDGFIINLKKGELLEHSKINNQIGFNLSEDWYNSYKRSFAAFTTGANKIIPQSKLKEYEFYRDSDDAHLPPFLKQITDPAILPSAKDNWNPADVWCVRKSCATHLKETIGKFYDEAKQPNISIEQLNKFVETEFKKGNLIGVSLKQVTGQQATCERIENDAKYRDGVEYCGPASKFSFNAAGTYFEIGVKMSCLKKDNIHYKFKFRPRSSAKQLTLSGEGLPAGRGTFDGAIDKKFVIAKYFPKADDIACILSDKEIAEAQTIAAAASLIAEKHPQNKQYAGYAKWLETPEHKFVVLCNTETKQKETHTIRRGLLNTYYAYLIDTYKDHQELFKDFYLSAKKVNEFSSIHYKIS